MLCARIETFLKTFNDNTSARDKKKLPFNA